MVLIYLWEMNLLVWITKWNRQTLGSCDDDHETIRQNFPRLLDFQDFQGPELRLSVDIKHGSGYNLLLRQHCWHCSKLSLLSLLTIHIKDHVKTIVYIYISLGSHVPWKSQCIYIYILCVKVLKCFKHIAVSGSERKTQSQRCSQGLLTQRVISFITVCNMTHV